MISEEEITFTAARNFINKWPDKDEYIDYCCEKSDEDEATIAKEAAELWQQMNLIVHNKSSHKIKNHD